MNVPLLIVIAYICCLVAISFYAIKLVKNDAVGFLLAGRSWPWYMVAFMLTGLAIGGASTLGCAQMAFESGLAAGWYDVAWGFGALLMGIFGASQWRKMGVSTVPEMLGMYYTTSSRVIGVILQFMIVMTITCLQFVAGGALLSAMLPGYFSLFTGMLLTAIIFVGIAILGGLWAGGLANLANVVVIWVGVTVGMVACWSLAGGTEAIISRLPRELDYFSVLEGLGWGVLVGWFIVMAIQSFTVQGVVQVGLAAKSPGHAKWGFIVGAILMAPLGFFSAYIGIAAKSLYPDIASVKALPTIIMNTHPVIAGLTLSGLWAADISTGVALLISSATLIERDIYEWSMERRGLKVPPERAFKISRALVLVLGLLGFILALKATSILNVLLTGLTLCAPFTIIFLFTVYLPGFCKKDAAFWTILVGGLIVFLWIFWPDIRVFPHAIYLEWLITLPLFMILCAVFKDPILHQKQNVQSLHMRR
jgi:SSS family solute:Na+ symporter